MRIDDGLVNETEELVGGQKAQDAGYIRPSSSRSSKKKRLDSRNDGIDDDVDVIDRMHVRNDYDSDDDRGYGSHRSQTGSRQGWQDQDAGGKVGTMTILLFIALGRTSMKKSMKCRQGHGRPSLFWTSL